jgi:hypothetical protein
MIGLNGLLEAVSPGRLLFVWAAFRRLNVGRFDERNDVADLPQPVSHAGRHRGRHAKRLMDSAGVGSRSSTSSVAMSTGGFHVSLFRQTMWGCECTVAVSMRPAGPHVSIPHTAIHKIPDLRVCASSYWRILFSFPDLPLAIWPVNLTPSSLSVRHTTWQVYLSPSGVRSRKSSGIVFALTPDSLAPPPDRSVRIHGRSRWRSTS